MISHHNLNPLIDESLWSLTHENDYQYAYVTMKHVMNMIHARQLGNGITKKGDRQRLERSHPLMEEGNLEDKSLRYFVCYRKGVFFHWKIMLMPKVEKSLIKAPVNH